MVVEDVGGAFEVGDGAGDLEDAVVGARAHVHAVHGVFQLLEAGDIGSAYLCKRDGVIWALQWMPGSSLKRRSWSILAAMTRWRIAALGSPGALLDI